MEKFTRKLQRMSGYSYSITLPKEVISALSWRERQKLTISFDEKNKRLIIKDWKK